MVTKRTCDIEGCGMSALSGSFCDEHECATGGCSMSNTTGDGDLHCRTHECAKDGCGQQAFGNEFFCVNHRNST